jgi:hypothetical protein
MTSVITQHVLPPCFCRRKMWRARRAARRRKNFTVSAAFTC